MENLPAKPNPELPFEEALEGLESIIETMQSGEENLISTIEAYERGVVYQKICEKRLTEAEGRIEEIRKRSASSDPADFELVSLEEDESEPKGTKQPYSSQEEKNNVSDNRRESAESARDDSFSLQDDGELF